MTTNQIELLRLGISPIDDRTVLNVEAGLEWVKDHTTLEFDMEKDEDLKALPSAVRLFLVKYDEYQALRSGVSSESIEGLSQSFNTGDMAAAIWQLAEEFLEPYLNSPVKFVAAKRRYK